MYVSVCACVCVLGGGGGREGVHGYVWEHMSAVLQADCVQRLDMSLNVSLFSLVVIVSVIRYLYSNLVLAYVLLCTFQWVK